MMSEPDLNARVFLAEVAHRLHHVWVYLRDFRVGQRSSVMIPFWNVHALQDECRQLGHTDLADRCVWMERALMELDFHNGSDNGERMAEIATACARIAERARLNAHGANLSSAKPGKLIETDAA